MPIVITILIYNIRAGIGNLRLVQNIFVENVFLEESKTWSKNTNAKLYFYLHTPNRSTTMNLGKMQHYVQKRLRWCPKTKPNAFLDHKMGLHTSTVEVDLNGKNYCKKYCTFVWFSKLLYRRHDSQFWLYCSHRQYSSILSDWYLKPHKMLHPINLPCWCNFSGCFRSSCRNTS